MIGGQAVYKDEAGPSSSYAWPEELTITMRNATAVRAEGAELVDGIFLEDNATDVLESTVLEDTEDIGISTY